MDRTFYRIMSMSDEEFAPILWLAEQAQRFTAIKAAETPGEMPSPNDPVEQNLHYGAQQCVQNSRTPSFLEWKCVFDPLPGQKQADQ